MDHLPISKGRLQSVPQIPYLSRLVDQNAPVMFDDDLSGGLSKALVPNLNELLNKDTERFFGQVQKELYFDLLKQTFGQGCCEIDFIDTRNDHHPVLNSTQLFSHASNWVAEAQKSESRSISAHIRLIRSQAKAKWLWCDILDVLVQDGDMEQLMIFTSIRILVLTILDMILTYDSKCVETADLASSCRLSTELLKWPTVPASYQPVVAFMVELDWCFPEILRMLRTYSLTTVFYLMHFQHNLTNHDLCAEKEACVSRNIDSKTYRAQHVSSSCSCQPIGPDSSRVLQILRTGHIPLVRCSLTKDDNVIFQVIPAIRMKRHIAISHVWSDGLAVPLQNKMFKCQLIALFPYMHKARKVRWDSNVIFGKYLVPPSYPILWWKPSFTFWIDVFCIPATEDEEAKKLRSTAISLINPTFSGASSVLVFDKTLTTISKPNASTTEIAARVVTSSWMSRSWTFLEASLAIVTTTFICAGSELVEMIDIAVHCEKPGSLGYSLLNQDLALTFKSFRLLHTPRITLSNFHIVWNALADRTLSHPKEIWGIAATLLGYNGAEIMSQQHVDQRLLCILRTLRSIPKAFLFKNFPRSSLYSVETRWLPTNVTWPIHEAEGCFAIVPEGISIRGMSNLKCVMKNVRVLPRYFVIELDQANLQKNRVPGGKTDVERLRVIMNLDHAPTEDELKQSIPQTMPGICLIFDIDGSDPFIRIRSNASGHGVCVAVTDRPTRYMAHAKFISSFSYRIAIPELPSSGESEVLQSQLAVHQAEWFYDWIILTCDPERWYRPKYHRQEQPQSVISMTGYSVYYVYFVPIFIIGATGVGLAVVISLKFTHNQNLQRIIYWILAGATLILVLLWVFGVVMFERLVFENWVRSFRRDNKDGARARWWQRIMPRG